MKEIKYLLALLLLLSMSVLTYALGRDDLFNEQVEPAPPATVTSQSEAPAGTTTPENGWNEDYWNQWNQDNSSSPDGSLQQQQSGTTATQEIREELTAEQQAAAVPEEIIPEPENPTAAQEKTKETTKITKDNKIATTATGSDAAATDSDAEAASVTNASTAFHWQYVIIGVFLLAAGAIAAYLAIHRKNAP